MKKVWIALLVLVVLVATAMPALAAGGPPPVRGKSGSFTLAWRAEMGSRFSGGRQTPPAGGTDVSPRGKPTTPAQTKYDR